MPTYRVAQKFWHIFVRLITSSNIDQFSNVFHYQQNICNCTITKIPPHLKSVAKLPCKISVSSKQQLKTRRNNTF